MYRIIASQIEEFVKNEKKVLVLLGARQVGKTTLLKNSFPDACFVNIEKGEYVDIFNKRDVQQINNILTSKGNKSQILILDEIQRLNNPGLTAKVIHDELPNIKLIISGSSSLEIASKAAESLAGRKTTFLLFPLTIKERLVQIGKLDKGIDQYQAEILLSMNFGLYPETIEVTNKENYLLELVDSTLLKDVFYLNLVKNTKNLYSLLKLLAYQIGQQVNISDIAQRLGIARETVNSYIEILKQLYIIFTLPPYTKKRRDEIGKTEKIFFYDLGIRNAIINDFSPVQYRVDFGNIFENYVVCELMKLNKYKELRFNFYYWRTKWGSEVDLVLVKDDEVLAYEIKTRKGVVSRAFMETYPNAVGKTITLNNLESILL